jgi:hypothetical protein
MQQQQLRIFAQRKLTFSSRLIPCASNPPKARQAQKPAQKCQKSSARGNFKTAPKQEKITNACVCFAPMTSEVYI